MITPGHYVDGMTEGRLVEEITERVKRNRRWLQDPEYSMVLDNVVVACVDVAVEYNGTILFGERGNEPWKGGWALCGGKMNPGENFEKTAVRHIERDLSIIITPDRPRFVCTDSWVWSRRAQAPQENGCHMQGTTYTVKLLQDEVERIQYKGDFGKIAWWEASAITKHQYIHPAHRKACLEILR